ncbi:hypothetical protein H6P81_017036 [Aristolochia fimbriata]|uniref:Cation/H+ exchanger domain-containing protein n=1 Tax=Aristolochia fimbriata TaxID=158543 RepID=A0AAV7E044_ARIFI|nr:hypothetical protein H6P81_017036 [Aristolochia fimbriata]
MASRASNNPVNITGASSQKTCLVPQKIWYNGYQSRNRSIYYYSLPLLLLQIITFIFITSFLRLIFRPLKQPMMIIEIIAGILMGPTLLGSYNDFDDLLFPAQGQMLSETLSWMGIIYYHFVEGLKQDLSSVTHAGKKEFVICVTGMLSSSLFALFFIFATAAWLIPDPIKALGFLKFFPQAMAITNFAVVQPILAELGLLNYELGRLSMSLSVMNNALGLIIALVNQSIRQSRRGLLNGLYTFISSCAMYVFLLVVAWPVVTWVVRRMPAGSTTRPDQGLVFSFLLLPLLAAAASDLMGGSLPQAALVLGMLIPPGPPLGSVLVEKLEAFVRYFLLPLFFVVNGRKFSVFDIPDWATWWFLLLLTFSSCLGKFVGTTLSALCFEMPYRESLTLALIMCFKGIVELLVFVNWMRFQVIDGPRVATLEVAIITMTTITTPLVRYLARRSTSPNIRRSIEQTRPNSEFRLMMCIHDEDNVPTLLNLLQASTNPKKRSHPINLCVLHLVQLVGRGAPVLTAHKKHRTDQGLSHPAIFRAFENLAKRSGDLLVLNPFTSISPHKTMHHDVCTLAMDKKVSLVIIPLHRQTSYGSEATSGTDRASRLIARNVLYDAPCSVGVLFDRSNMRNHVSRWISTTTGEFSFRVGIVFLGGADDREALCCVSRMVENPGVSLMVLRCLAPYGGLDHERERVLDDELMGEFRLKTLQREGVVYREEMVLNVGEMVNSIRSMGCDFDLMVVGRQHPVHSLIVDALTGWTECVELGVIGDFFASSDFANCGASVLSVQQKIIRFDCTVML